MGKLLEDLEASNKLFDEQKLSFKLFLSLERPHDGPLYISICAPTSVFVRPPSRDARLRKESGSRTSLADYILEINGNISMNNVT